MGFRVDVTLSDASVGLDVSGDRPSANLKDVLATGDPDQDLEPVQLFLDVLTDYVDGHNGRCSMDGMERDDYESEGVLAFPRDAPLQLREEIFWIDGLLDVLPGVTIDRGFFQIIPPAGLSFSQKVGGDAKANTGTKPSFVSSSLGFIKFLAGLSADEMQLVIEARQRWLADSVSPEETLSDDPELLAKIESKFEFETESSVVTVLAVARSLDGGIIRELWLTRDTRSATAFADSNRELFACWEKLTF